MESERETMEFSQKLVQLRRREGLSQEQLADRLGVTRQSVSKWEGGAAMPDVGKLISLSELFGVSVDYLVKDYLEEPAREPEMDETQARRLEAEFNSKRLYCVRQARRKFFGNSPAGIELGGYPAELVHVTPASLKAEYDRIQIGRAHV